MDILSISSDTLLRLINAMSPTFIDKTTVSAAIIRTNPATSKREILLLKRNSDAEFYPGVFEMPEAKTRPLDASIRATIMREVGEKTDLKARGILYALPTLTYTAVKKVPHGGFSAGGQRERAVREEAMQLAYVVAVDDDGAGFRVKKRTHSLGMWVDEEGLERIQITDILKEYVLDALWNGEGQRSGETTSRISHVGYRVDSPGYYRGWQIQTSKGGLPRR